MLQNCKAFVMIENNTSTSFCGGYGCIRVGGLVGTMSLAVCSQFLFLSLIIFAQMVLSLPDGRVMIRSCPGCDWSLWMRPICACGSSRCHSCEGAENWQSAGPFIPPAVGPFSLLQGSWSSRLYSRRNSWACSAGVCYTSARAIGQNSFKLVPLLLLFSKQAVKVLSSSGKVVSAERGMTMLCSTWCFCTVWSFVLLLRDT